MSLRKLNVIYCGWGERWLLGTLADNGRELLFEYSPQALKRGLELSPLRLRLREQAYGDFPAHLQRLPGFIADALPDGWGALVMDRLFRKHGLEPAALSPLDRLAFINGHGMGALEFEPADTLDLVPHDATLLTLARQARAVIAGDDGEALRQLALIGGSPHGARPKVLVYYDPVTRMISSLEKTGHEPWLVKFQAQNEHKEVCALEHLYAELARLAGLEMTETRYFDLDAKLSGFGTRRFDVEAGLRVPVQTLAAALHANFRLPSSVDYTTFLRAVRAYCRDEREVKKGFERAVFNVIFNNRDDHPKNLSFRLTCEGHWKLSPAYDLTFCEGPGGEHQMDICGEGREVSRANFLELAHQGGVDAKGAAESIERIAELAAYFRQHADGHPIRRQTLDRVGKAIEANRARMRSGISGPTLRPEKPKRTARAELLGARRKSRVKSR